MAQVVAKAQPVAVKVLRPLVVKAARLPVPPVGLVAAQLLVVELLPVVVPRPVVVRLLPQARPPRWLHRSSSALP